MSDKYDGNSGSMHLGSSDNSGYSSNSGSMHLGGNSSGGSSIGIGGGDGSQFYISLFKAFGAYIGWALVFGLPLYLGTENVVAGIVGAVIGLAVALVFRLVPFFKKHKILQTVLMWLPWIVVAIIVVIRLAVMFLA